MATYGLRNTANGSQVPLKNIEIKVFIKGFVANVEASLTYRNEESDPIEALFTFPVDEGSAVYKFEAEIESRLVIGECQEKKQAEQTYQDALAAGRSAFLLKESDASRDVFECSVGNLPPQTEALIRFAYVLELTLEGDGAVRFSYPAVLVQRYGSPGKPLVQATVPVPDPSRSGSLAPSLDHVRTLPYTVSFQAEVVTNHAIRDIQAEDKLANLSVIYSKGRKSAEVRLAGGFSFDHDLVLYVWYSGPGDPHVIHEKGNQEKDGFLKRDVVMLNFFPKDLTPSATEAARAEFIFVVDRSGSMGGDRIVSAKAALGTFLENLPADCYFNVISFGSAFSALFPRSSLKNRAKNRQKAVRLQQTMGADMGGTEMIKPFEFVYNQPAIPGYSRQVLLLTDGGIWNGPQLIDLVRKNSATTRVFTFGIGSGASTMLVKGVARAGRGRSQFITDELDRLPIKVEQVMRCAVQPSVDDVSIDWNLPAGVKVMSLPTQVPAVFQDECLVIYAVLTGTEQTKKNDKLKAVLKGNIRGKAFSSTVQLKLEDGATVDEALTIHRLAAKAQIKELEDEGMNDDKKAKIVLLSTSANIVSKHTAFVGVDKERPQLVKGELQERQVPLAKERSRKSTASRGGGRGGRGGGGGRGGRGGRGGGGRGSALGSTSNVLQSTSSAPSSLGRLWGGGAGPRMGSPGMMTGGGSSTSALAQKYLTGKAVTFIGETDSDEEATSITSAAPRQKSQKRKKRSNLVMHKKHRKESDVKNQLFAPWHDGIYYPINKILDAGRGHKVKVQFRDKREAWVKVGELLPASRLSSGDIVGVKDGHSYIKGLVLEYSETPDSIVVARCDGAVVKGKPAYYNIPAETAKAMKLRRIGSFQPVKVCQFLGQTGPITMTTSDVAELGADGWITGRLVEYWLSVFWRTLPEIDRQRAVYLSPWFQKNLGGHVDRENLGGRSDCANQSTRLRDREESLERTKLWSDFVDLRKTEGVFVPVFDQACIVIMDSYYTAARQEETTQIKRFLTAEAKRQGVQIEFEGRIRKPTTPVQYNESDCGVCMLLCVRQCFKDNLIPRPHLDWFDRSATLELRKELCQQIMIQWDTE